MAAQLRDNKLDFWVQNNYNVLFKGKHGVGKTSMIIQAFDRNNLKWKYFSASTMDPWVDFIGCPKEQLDENGKSYLGLVRPKDFQDDEVEAIFFDEYNRSHKKVRNAVMELIQFKSINGKKFNNLKIVWAAVNPDDDESEDYDVEKIDPAQLDRFHVHVDVPYKPVLTYFTKQYGKEIAEAGCSWWNELPTEMKNSISPRRLDYALDMYKNKGDLRDVLPTKSNISKLLLTLKEGPVKKKLEKLMKAKNEDETRKFLAQENNYAAAINYITKTAKFKEYFLPLVPEEKIASLTASNKTLQKYFAENCGKVAVYGKVLNEIVAANQNKTLVKNLKKHMPRSVKRRLSGVPWEKTLKSLHTEQRYNTQQRVKVYTKLMQEIPENMTLKEAISTVDLINAIVDRSHAYSLNRKYPDLHKALSTCFSVIARDTPYYTFDDIINSRNWYAIDDKLSSVKSKIKIGNLAPFAPIKTPISAKDTDKIKELVKSASSMEELMDMLDGNPEIKTQKAPF